MEFGYPNARKFHSAVKNGNDIYILGGWSNNGVMAVNPYENATIYDDVWKLSLFINEGHKCYIWTKTSTQLKMALFFHTSAITPEGCVYTFGGCIDVKSMYPSNKLQRFWIQPPKLEQIAAFRLYIDNPHLGDTFKQSEINRLKIISTTNSNASVEKEHGKSAELLDEIEQKCRELLQTKPSRMVFRI